MTSSTGATTSRSRSRSPTPRTGRSTAARSRSRSCSSTTSTATPRTSKTGCTGARDRGGRRVARRLHRRRHQRHLHGRRPGHDPAADDDQQHVVQIRRQQVEFVQEPVRHDRRQRAGRRDRSGRRADPRQPGAGDWLALNRRFNLRTWTSRSRSGSGGGTNAGRHGPRDRRDPLGQPDRADRPDGDAEVDGRRQQQHVHQPDVRAGLRGFAAGVPGVPAGGRAGRRTGSAT